MCFRGRVRGRARGRVRGSFCGRVRGRVGGHIRGRCRLSNSLLIMHTSTALAGSPLAVPSRGPRGILSLVVTITLDCRSTVIEGEIGVD